MSLIKKHPHYIFRIDVQPELTDDLIKIDHESVELFITGKTKNLEKLKSFANVEKLWIYSINQDQFNTIINLVNPKMLYIYNMRVDDLSLLGLLSNIEVLALEWNSKANKLWDLSSNVSLNALSIKDFSKLRDISFLNKAKRLELLDLSGGDSNSLKFDNLEPLKDMEKLKYLGLSNIKVQDDSLSPISDLKWLEELEVSNQFPTEEYAKLSVALPNTKCDKFKAFVNLPSSIGSEDIMVVGKRKPFLNSKTDKKRLEKYEEQFKALQNKYKSSLV